jgi:uncharacterized protein YjbI with pentapeptide repeats
MAKKNRSSVLNRFAGKKIVFNGKFDYGVKEMAEAQQATVLADLSDKTDFLVLADLNAGKTIQKKAESLNRKGATIQVMDITAFWPLLMPTSDELVALLKNNRNGAEALACLPFSPNHKLRLVGATLDSLDLSEFDLSAVTFEKCSFIGATLNGTKFNDVIDCDFSKATGVRTSFQNVERSRFVKGEFSEAAIVFKHLGDIDFTAAKFSTSSISEDTYGWFSGTIAPRSAKRTVGEAPRFSKASLRGCTFSRLKLEGANFDNADLTGASFTGSCLDQVSFRKAKATDAVFVGASMQNADLSNAVFAGANFAESNLTGATLQGADLTGANLRGAMVEPSALETAKSVDGAATAIVLAGPALTELDSIFNQARKVEVSFHVGRSHDENGVQLKLTTYPHGGSHFIHLLAVQTDENAKVGSFLPIGHIQKPFQSAPSSRRPSNPTFSEILLQAARVLGHNQVQFETVEVSSTKSPKGGKELRKLVMQGIAEAFAQEMPSDDVLAESAKKQRAAKQEQKTGTREQREQAKAEAEKLKAKANKQLAKKIEKAVGKVTDIATFLKALELRIEKPKIDKATKMLKASGFKLFNDVTDQWVSGVVKSQTDPDLVYACRLDHEGHYS